MVAPVKRQIAHSNGTITVVKECPFCGFDASVTVRAEPYQRWVSTRSLIQDELPMLSTSEREVLISGCHSVCYDGNVPG